MLAMCSVGGNVYAAFGGLVPLSWSGQVTYSYGYSNNSGNESETTNFLVGANASGYVWRPWFATTSLALNVGLSNTETATSSSDATVGTGSFSLGIFPRSRFPFSMSYSRTDSRAQSFQDISQISADTSFVVTRLSLRQSYRPRAYNQSYVGWYSLTDYDAESFTSKSEVYGLTYLLRLSHQSLTIDGTHSGSESSDSANKPSTDVVSANHVYTPSPELGVNTLVSYVEVDPGGDSPLSKDSQASSNFFWRPEHRAVNVSGGVRLTESKSEGAVSTVVRGLNTSLGLGYRLTRSLNLSANASVGTSDSGDAQTLSTAQAVNIAYTGGHQQFGGVAYSWQWNGGASNATTRVESAGMTTSADRQSVSAGIGHNFGKSWASSGKSSMSATFSQSASAAKSSDQDQASKTVNNGASLSWSRRGGQGSTYASSQITDSRSFGLQDTVFDSLGASLVSDYSINRLSSVSGNLNFTASQNETENSLGEKSTSGTRNLGGGLAYRNDRPFGVYNLRFTSNLVGSKQIDSDMPSTTLRWEGVFRYSLGLLETSLTFRVSESAGGNLAKSMNFQATRSF